MFFFCGVYTISRAAGLPGGQLVDVTAAVFGPDDNFVGGDELSSSPGLVVVAGHRAEQRVVACVKHLTHDKERKHLEMHLSAQVRSD